MGPAPVPTRIPAPLPGVPGPTNALLGPEGAVGGTTISRTFHTCSVRMTRRASPPSEYRPAPTPPPPPLSVASVSPCGSGRAKMRGCAWGVMNEPSARRTGVAACGGGGAGRGAGTSRSSSSSSPCSASSADCKGISLSSSEFEELLASCFKIVSGFQIDVNV